MRKFITLLVLVGMVVFGRSSDVWAQTSDNPLEDGGWTFVAHISNQGGMFDGIGSLDPNYEYGTRVKLEDLLPGTPDFQRPFPFDAVNILFITGDRAVWAIADFDDLRTLITAFGNDQTPNLALEVRISGIISNVTGNVLSRGGFNIVADPWISMNGSHGDGVTNDQIIWGENDYGGSTGHAVLKNGRNGMDVFISGVPEENVHNIASHSDSTAVTGAALTTLTSGAQISDSLHSHTGGNGNGGGGGPGNFYAEDFITPDSTTGGIQEAFTACNDAQGGVVFAPQGLTEIDATGLTSPIINIPVFAPNVRPTTVCEFRGYGMNAQAISTVSAARAGGSTILITNASAMTSEGAGLLERKVIIRANANNYEISHMTILVEDSDVHTRGIWSMSAANTSFDIGENGINNWRIHNVAIGGTGRDGNGGIGIEWQFSLKGVFRDSEVYSWDTAAVKYAQLESAPSFKNNANLFSGVKLRASVIGFLLEETGACDDVNLIGMTIEGNVVGTEFNNTNCEMMETRGHYEQTSGAIADRRNILITNGSNAAQYVGIGMHFSGSLNPGMDIFRETSNTFQGFGKDMLIGSRLAHGVKYDSHSISMINNHTYLSAGEVSGDVSGVFSSYAADCKGEGTREAVGIAGDGCWERDTKLLFICHPLEGIGDREGVCDHASEWIIAHKDAASECAANQVILGDGSCANLVVGGNTPSTMGVFNVLFPPEDFTGDAMVSGATIDAGLGLERMNGVNGDGGAAPHDGAALIPGTADGETNKNAFQAAIDFACANGYDEVYIPAGKYRIGKISETDFEAGVILTSEACPDGLVISGDGMGETILLTHFGTGGAMFRMADEADPPPGGIGRNALVTGINTNYAITDFIHNPSRVIGITTDNPAILTFGFPGNRATTPGTITHGFVDDDLINIRNCSGSTELNERVFRVRDILEDEDENGGSFTLHDPVGFTIDGAKLTPWTSGPDRCIISAFLPDLKFVFRNFTLMDDDPYSAIRWNHIADTFVDGNVDLGTCTHPCLPNTLEVSGHPFVDDEGPLTMTSSTTLPSGLSLLTDYFVNVTSEADDFVDGNVDTGTDTIEVIDHPFVDDQGPLTLTTSTTLPEGLDEDTYYFVSVTSEAATFVDADVNTGIDIIEVVGHPFADKEGPLTLTTTTTLPEGLDEDTYYFVNVGGASGDDLGFSLEAGGVNEDIISATNGGLHTIQFSTGDNLGFSLTAGGANEVITSAASGGDHTIHFSTGNNLGFSLTAGGANEVIESAASGGTHTIHNPNKIKFTTEETHGMYGGTAGAFIHIDAVEFIGLGDEPIELGGTGGKILIENIVCEGAFGHCITIKNTASAIIRNNFLYRETRYLSETLVPTANFAAGSGGGGAIVFEHFAGNQQISNIQVYGNVIKGEWGQCFILITSETGGFASWATDLKDDVGTGGIIENIDIYNNLCDINPRPTLCDKYPEACESVFISTRGNPINQIHIHDNILFGPVNIFTFNGWAHLLTNVVVENNIIRPQRRSRGTQDGVFVNGSGGVVIRGNDIRGFERGCLRYQANDEGADYDGASTGVPNPIVDSFTFTTAEVDNLNNLVDKSNNFKDGYGPIRLITDTTLPNGLDEDVDYFLVISYDTPDEIQFSLTPGGVAEEFDNNGVGNHTMLGAVVDAWTFEEGDVTFSGGDFITALDNPFRDRDGPVRLTSTGTLPDGLSTGTNYFLVIDPEAPDVIEFSLRRGGEVEPIIDDGIGLHTIDLSHFVMRLDIIDNYMECEAGGLWNMIGPSSFLATGGRSSKEDGNYFNIIGNTMILNENSVGKRFILIDEWMSGVNIKDNTMLLHSSRRADASTVDSAMYIEGSDNMRIINNTVTGPIRGLFVGGGHNHRTTKNLFIEGNNFTGEGLTGFPTFGMDLLNSRNVTIRGNTISNYKDDGIRIRNSRLDNVVGYTITDNDLVDTDGITFECTVDCAGFGYKNVVISDNRIDLGGRSGNGAIILDDVVGGIISNNYIIGTDLVEGLKTLGVTNNLAVFGNVVEGGGDLEFGTTAGNSGTGCSIANAAGAASICGNNLIIP